MATWLAAPGAVLLRLRFNAGRESTVSGHNLALVGKNTIGENQKLENNILLWKRTLQNW